MRSLPRERLRANGGGLGRGRVIPAYRLREVQVEFGGRLVLDIDTLDLAAGRVTAVVGPNGAGKTTLLRVLAFLRSPTAGSVEFFGQDVAHGERDLTERRRQVTLVLQSPLLFQRSVRANV